MEKAKIRFLGAKWRKGIPNERCIKVGGQKFWNYRRFPEQLDDGSYLRDIDFYMKHQAKFDDSKLFIVDFVEDASSKFVEAEVDITSPDAPENLKGRECPHCKNMIRCQNPEYFERFYKSHLSICFNRQEKKRLLGESNELQGELPSEQTEE